MGALYEDVEKFFGDIFAFYGRYLAKYPLIFIALSVATSGLLGLGLINIEYETSVGKLYAPLQTQARKDQDAILKLFPENTRDDFHSHQMVSQPTYGEIIVTSTKKAKVMDTESFVQVSNLYQEVVAMTSNEQAGKWKDVCAKLDGKCVADGLDILNVAIKNGACFSNESVLHSKGASYHSLGGVFFADGCVRAQAFRLRFNLKHDTQQQRRHSLQWESSFLAKMAANNHGSTRHAFEHIKIFYTSSKALDLELTEHTGRDTRYFTLTIVIMTFFASLVTAGGNCVSTRVLLAQCGVLAALMSILASFGLLSMCGMQFVDICGVMPFLVLGIGVDDMFILMAGWRMTDVKDSIEDRIANTFRSSAISVTITSLTNLLAFCIGATNPFLSVKNFCIYAGVAIILCYFNQLTFFGGCLVLHARRVRSALHCFTCRKVKTTAELQSEGEPPSNAQDCASPMERLPSRRLSAVLLTPIVKILVLLSFVLYLVVCLWGAHNLKTGLKLENVVPKSSYLAKYMDLQQQFFASQGPAVMFVVTQPVRYNEVKVKANLTHILDQAQQSNYVQKGFKIDWLSAYLAFCSAQSIDVTSWESFVLHLNEDFLPTHAQYRNDVRLSEDGRDVIASRFYVSSLRFTDSEHEAEMMLAMRHLASNSTLPVVAFSPEFIFYEHHVSIWKNTLLAVGVAVIGMLFIALMFIPHAISITCVAVTMVTIVVGMFGFMHFWNLELSAITTVQIILSVGFSVDFTVHMSHAFMTATGKNRNERVTVAMEKVGVPIINGAVTSILGILMLAFASSYIFQSFFKTMLLVILLGVYHALVLLPVVLSFVGPRRTSKPRVFIPVNPAARSGGEDYFREYVQPKPEKAKNWNEEDMEMKPMDTIAEEHQTLLVKNSHQAVAQVTLERNKPSMFHMTDVVSVLSKNRFLQPSDPAQPRSHSCAQLTSSDKDGSHVTPPLAHSLSADSAPSRERKLQKVHSLHEENQENSRREEQRLFDTTGM